MRRTSAGSSSVYLWGNGIVPVDVHRGVEGRPITEANLESRAGQQASRSWSRSPWTA